MLSPWRFADGGWRYVRRGSVNQYLNHPNKVNSIGYNSSKKEHSSLSKYSPSTLGYRDQEINSHIIEGELSSVGDGSKGGGLLLRGKSDGKSIKSHY